MLKQKYKFFFISFLFLFSGQSWSIEKNKLGAIEERLKNLEASHNRFTTKSEMRVRHQHRTNTPSPNRNDLSNFYDMRVRAWFEYKNSDDLSLVFAPQMTKNFGDGTPNDSNRNEGEATGNKLADMGILEAYLNYGISDNLKLKFGRQAFKYGDGLIINNPKFNNVGRVFDAIRGTLNHSLGTSDIFLSRVNDGDSDTSIAGGRTGNDTDFLGWYNKLNILNIDELDLYLLGYLDRGSGTNQYGKDSHEIQEVYSLGFRLKEKVKNWLLLTEIILQKGSNQPSSESNLALVEIGYNLNRKLSFWFETLYVEKDYRPFYTSRHKYLGHLDVFGIRNINSFRFRTKYKVSDKTKFMVDLHKFSRNDDQSDVYNLVVNNTVGSQSGMNGVSDLGQEIDFKFDTKLKKGLGLTTGYAYFMPGKYFKNQDMDIDAHYFYTELNYNF